MFGLSKTFQLDPRLKADTFVIREDELASLLLMNDTRWPWVILVPRVVDVEELHDLSPGKVEVYMQLAAKIGELLKADTNCEKINIATIGNMVRQLHIHIIARDEGDPNWPSPVWGFGERDLYSGAEGKARAADLKKALHVSFFS
jgi:diadenosine tetraphosphate (Ap4A) HIT family hydrolase